MAYRTNHLKPLRECSFTLCNTICVIQSIRRVYKISKFHIYFGRCLFAKAQKLTILFAHIRLILWSDGVVRIRSAIFEQRPCINHMNNTRIVGFSYLVAEFCVKIAKYFFIVANSWPFNYIQNMLNTFVGLIAIDILQRAQLELSGAIERMSSDFIGICVDLCAIFLGKWG